MKKKQKDLEKFAKEAIKKIEDSIFNSLKLPRDIILGYSPDHLSNKIVSTQPMTLPEPIDFVNVMDGLFRTYGLTISRSDVELWENHLIPGKMYKDTSTGDNLMFVELVLRERKIGVDEPHSKHAGKIKSLKFLKNDKVCEIPIRYRITSLPQIEASKRIARKPSFFYKRLIRE